MRMMLARGMTGMRSDTVEALLLLRPMIRPMSMFCLSWKSLSWPSTSCTAQTNNSANCSGQRPDNMQGTTAAKVNIAALVSCYAQIACAEIHCSELLLVLATTVELPVYGHA